MGRPSTHPIRKIMSFASDMLEAVDQFRARRGIATEVEAVRQLVALGLEAGAGEVQLSPGVARDVEVWRARNAPGLEHDEVVQLLMRRGMGKGAPDLRPILLPPPKDAPVPAPEAAPAGEMRFDEDTERRIAIYQRAVADPVTRHELIGQLLVVFEDRLETEIDFYRAEAMPEATRVAAIQRLVEAGLAEYDGKEPPAPNRR